MRQAAALGEHGELLLLLRGAAQPRHLVEEHLVLRGAEHDQVQQVRQSVLGLGECPELLHEVSVLGDDVGGLGLVDAELPIEALHLTVPVLQKIEQPLRISVCFPEGRGEEFLVKVNYLLDISKHDEFPLSKSSRNDLIKTLII